MLQRRSPGGWRRHRRSKPEQGFTVLEIATAALVFAVGCLTVAGVIIPMNRQRESTEAKAQVIESMEKTFEQIRGLDPRVVNESYQGKTLPLVDVDGTLSGGDQLTMNVDSTNPTLLDVSFTATWDVGGVTDTFTIRTKVYNP